VKDFNQAAKLAVITPEVASSILAEPPGTITAVLPVSPESPYSTEFDLNTVGVRLPNSGPIYDVLQLTSPLFATSANFSGAPEFKSITEAKAAFGEQVDYYFPDFGTSLANRKASKVVDFTGFSAVTLR
jgi:tRNA A37 threonylcarbamoyladenosine synthetase subunit TsaC/SUA5/YrdC